MVVQHCILPSKQDALDQVGMVYHKQASCLAAVVILWTLARSIIYILQH